MQGAAGAVGVVAFTFVLLGALRGEVALPTFLLPVVVVCAVLVWAARRGFVLAAGYGLSVLAMAGVVGGTLVRGHPGHAAFYLLLGVVLAAITLPPPHVAAVIAVGLAAEAFVAMWPYPADVPATLGSVALEGSVLYVATAGVALLTAFSVAQLVAHLRTRDEEARRATERSEALAEELERAQRMEALARLAGGVAHDFNNLLTVMRGCATLLEDTVPKNTEAATDLRDLSDAVDRGAALTRQLLAFSKRDVVRATILDLQGVVEGARDLLQRMAGSSVQLKLEAEGGPWPVWASLAQLEQILMNLVVNARDAMDGRGGLRIKVDRAHDARGGKVCRLLVQDTGVGMSDEVKARLFEPFFTTKGPGKGTGLGLATVYGIVDRLGGRIDVESSPGHGATFTVHLPEATGAAEAAGTPAATAAEPKAGLAVCVVDDEAPLRNQMARILGGAGYRVLTFGSAEALMAEGEHPCDVLVADINLPGISGVVLAEKVRAHHPKTRVVLVSGYTADPTAAARLVHQGVTFVPKPFEAATLLAAVAGAPVA